MCACTLPTCPRRLGESARDGNRGGGFWGGIGGEDSSRSGRDWDDDGRSSEASGRAYGRRYHNSNVFTPPPTFMDQLKKLQVKIIKSIGDAYVFWKKLRGDRFRWELFKSVLFFTMGLKLFNDISRHMNKPVYGGSNNGDGSTVGAYRGADGSYGGAEGSYGGADGSHGGANGSYGGADGSSRGVADGSYNGNDSYNSAAGSSGRRDRRCRPRVN